MHLRQDFHRGLFVLFVSIACSASLNSVSVFADSEICQTYLLSSIRPLTFNALRELNTARLLKVSIKHPLPGFTDLAREVTIEQEGEPGPRAFHALNGPRRTFVMTPAPTAAMDTAVNLHEEGNSIPVHVDQIWHGRRTSTTVYASLPKVLKPRAGDFLIGKEYPVVDFHLHGGGTPTATGKNAMSIGQNLAQAGIPVIGLDLPGHGQATRQLEGLTTFEGQVDWVLSIADQLLDPSVKIVLTGHSWGGEFALFMWLHSDEPKYARIVAYVPLAPPIDVSLGGDESAKYEFEERFERDFAEYEPQIARADFAFHTNILHNGKISDVGSYFTAFSHMDYKTPPVTVEQQRNLKPMHGFVGRRDGLVYVAREAYYAKFLENLQAPSSFTVLDAGMNWQSKDATDPYFTGHNLWDVFIPGTRTPVVYKFLTDLALKEAGPQGMGSEESDEAEIKLNEMYRYYANFILFRELVEHEVQYIQVPTANRQVMDDRKLAIDGYLVDLDKRESLVQKDVESAVLSATARLRGEYGIKESISIERAREELAWPELTPARREALNNYMSQVRASEDEMQMPQVDAKFDQEMEKLSADFGPFMKGLGVDDVTNFRAKHDEYNSLKRALSADEKRIRSTLSRLQQLYTTSVRNKQARFSHEREVRVAEIPRPPGVADPRAAIRELTAPQSPERRAQLRNFVTYATATVAALREAGAVQLHRDLEAVAKPAGIQSIAQARQAKLDQDAIRSFTFAPPGEPEIANLAAEIRELSEQRRQLQAGSANGPNLNQLEKQQKDGVAKRLALAKSWDNMWKKALLSSPRLRRADQLLQQKLEHYTVLYDSYEHDKSEWLRQLKREGRLDEQNILAGRPDLKVKRATLAEAKADFEALRDQVDKQRWEEAVAGNLESDPPVVAAEAIKVALALWGKQGPSHPSADGLVAPLRILEDQIEGIRRQESVLHQTIDLKQWQYTQAMAAHGHPLPVEIRRISIRAALDLSYPELIAKLRTDSVLLDAFKNTIKQGTVYMGLLRKEAQSKDVGNY